MLVVAAHDTIAPPSAVETVARKAAAAGVRVEVERFDVGHFEIYEGEVFESRWPPSWRSSTRCCGH